MTQTRVNAGDPGGRGGQFGPADKCESDAVLSPAAGGYDLTKTSDRLRLLDSVIESSRTPSSGNNLLSREDAARIVLSYDHSLPTNPYTIDDPCRGPWALGYVEGDPESPLAPGVTYDSDPSSPRSEAYDEGRSLAESADAEQYLVNVSFVFEHSVITITWETSVTTDEDTLIGAIIECNPPDPDHGMPDLSRAQEILVERAD